MDLRRYKLGEPDRGERRRKPAVHRDRHTGSPITPAAIREALIQTGVPAAFGAEIGPRPDPVAALAVLFPGDDCDASGIPDHLEIDAGLLADANANGLADSCETLCPADLDGDFDADLDDILLYFLNFGGSSSKDADLDRDGDEDLDDILSFFASFTACLF